MSQSTKVVALDIHRDSITVALADPARRLRFCYEAGPCGYGVYRLLTGLGHECRVVAPSLIPAARETASRPTGGMRWRWPVCTASATAVRVPDPEQEAMRDLERCREDFKHAERRVRQRLTSFLLRHRRVYSGGRRWTQAHFRWLETPRFDHPA